MGGECIPYQETVTAAMCRDCPLAGIPDTYWEENIRIDLTYRPEDLSRILVLLKEELAALDPHDLEAIEEQLGITHIELLNLLQPADFDTNVAGKARTGAENTLAIPDPAEPESIRTLRSEYPHPAAQAFLGCISRMLRAMCQPGSELPPLPLSLYKDNSLAADTLDTLARYGESDEVEAMATRIQRALSAQDQAAVRKYAESYTWHGVPTDRAFLFATAQLLREKG